MTQASLARRFACDGFLFPISALAADEIARLAGCFEPAAADSGFDTRAVAVHDRVSRMCQAAIHAANRTA